MEEAEATRRDRGFTLIEMMAVVVIIGLLTGVVGTVVFRQLDKAKIVSARTQIDMLDAALEYYRMDNGKFPTSEQGLVALVEAPTVDPVPRSYPEGGYLKDGRIPTDPWGEPYHYEMPGQNNPHSYDLWSLGADNAPGGEGTDADIGNWAAEDQEPTG